MSIRGVLIELTLEESVDPHEVQRLLIDFLKASPPIFKSMNIRYLRLGKNDGTEEHLVNLTDASEDFGCTTCCMDDMEESTIMNFDGNLVPRDPNGILFNDRDTNQELNNTFYMDCENHSNSIVKEETSTFVLKREPSMDVSSLQQFYTKTTSKRKSSLKELETSTKAISQNAVKPRNITSTMHSTQNAEGPEKSMNFVEDQVNKASNRAIDDSVFDRPTLGEFKNDNEKVDETKEKGAEKDSLLDEVNKDLNVDEFESDPHEASETSERTKSNLDQLDASSNGAIDDSSFDRSPLYESQNESEEIDESKSDGTNENTSKAAMTLPSSGYFGIKMDNLHDVLEAVKRGDMPIDEMETGVYDFDADYNNPMESNENGNETQKLEDTLPSRLKNVQSYKKGIYWWKRAKCLQCPHLVFKQAREVIAHIVAKHVGNDVPKIFRCTLCSMTSNYKFNLLKEHLRKRHNIRQSKNDQSSVEEKWHPLTLKRTLQLAEEVFPSVAQPIERYLIWLVRSGKVDYEALTSLTAI
ncbi:unnamed protein product, partial [Mesorhabditis belari]|uniref:C2H2-type domain-containing protein n=1 Tax=Mesorhabditis belari TaxID=2138241 RepID=A0AAF3F5E5_9BILA